MKEILIIVVSCIIGLVTFGLIAKKYGSNCIP